MVRQNARQGDVDHGDASGECGHVHLSAKVHLFLHGVAEREYNLPVAVFHNHRRKSRRNKERDIG